LKENELKKRKKTLEEVDEIKKKKRRIEHEISGLLKSADDFAEKVETTGRLLWLTKSNSLRKTAKDKKKKKLIDISKLLDQTVESLKH
jgi:hypothetical protein